MRQFIPFKRQFIGRKPLWLVLIVLCVMLSSCHSLGSNARRFQRTLHREQTMAEQQTEQLKTYLQQSVSIDSLRLLTANSDSHALFYIFDQRRLVYWTQNWLALQDMQMRSYDTWSYMRLRNAHVLCRWTNVGRYDVLTVLPLQYAYPTPNPVLSNDFLPPYRVSDRYHVTSHRHEGAQPITDAQGRYLFSLCSADETEEIADYRSFSYNWMAEEDTPDSSRNRWLVMLYFWLSLLLIVTILVVGLLGLVRKHGFRNMSLASRLVYVVLGSVLICFVYIMLMSTRYIRMTYDQQAHADLQSKAHFVQSYLQSMYYWDMTLSPAKAQALNVDLRDLSYTTELDIHVYDMYGILSGSSAPQLFEAGVLSPNMSADAFFSSATDTICTDHFGPIACTTAYVPFYNGSFVQIGYIGVPRFISPTDRMRQTDAFLGQLLPLYLLILLLALLASYWAARSITSPISILTDKMRHFQIGKADNHIHYDNHDELGILVERYNRMVDKVEESTERLARSEREGAWRTMARQIAHEINNPLTPMKLTIQKLQRQYGSERFDESFHNAAPMLIEQIDSLARIAQSFSTFAKQPEVKPSTVDVALKLSNVLLLQRNNPEQVPIRYYGPDHGVQVWADGEQISQVFTNIIRNAIQALEHQPDADIIVMLKEGYSPEEVEISISDNGPGIPEEIQERIFRPNFTTKSTGMGLGLAISKNIVEGSGGKICFKTSEKGTTFFVYFKKS